MREDPSLSSSLQIARRVLRRAGETGSDDGGAPTAAELQRACNRLKANLCETMGADGCTALFARALARTEAAHPALKSVRRVSEGDIALDDVLPSVETHGLAAVTEALEAFLAALIDVLGRLIGEDMALRLMLLPDPGPNSRHPSDRS